MHIHYICVYIYTHTHADKVCRYTHVSAHAGAFFHRQTTFKSPMFSGQPKNNRIAEGILGMRTALLWHRELKKVCNENVGKYRWRIWSLVFQ